MKIGLAAGVLAWGSVSAPSFSQPAPVAPAPAAATPPIAADPKLAARLRAADAWIETQLAAENIPGASMAIVHDQQLIWARGFGFANTDKRVRATPQTRYSICSVSKLFTSMAAMRERDMGRFDIDRPIGDYVRWYNVRDVATPDGPVTARGIMSHVAGLPRESDIPYWSEASFPDLAAVKARLGQQQNLYRAYDTHQYSNLGMALLGEAVAATSRQDYHEYVRANFLRPLGMSRTTSELPVHLRGREFAIGYAARRKGWSRPPIPSYTLNAIAPAAGFASTVEDLGKFASWQFRLLASGGANLLKSSTLREMHRVHWMTPDDPSQTWGLGFASYQHAGKTMVGHGGYCPGYRTSFMMRPKDKLAYIVMINADDGQPGRFAQELYDLTSDDIVRAAKPSTGPVPAPAPAAADAPPEPKVDLALFEGAYASRHSADDAYVAPYGNELMVIDLFADKPTGDIARLRHVSGTTFRRVRKDDSLAEEVRFELGKDGRPVRMWWHSNYAERRS